MSFEIINRRKKELGIGPPLIRLLWCVLFAFVQQLRGFFTR